MKKFIFIAAFCFVSVGLACLFNFWSRHVDMAVAEEERIFDSTNFEDELTKIDIKYHGTSFTVSDKSHTYVFYPQALNHNHTFSRFAEVGDSIYKRPNSDTMILVKHKHRYFYEVSGN